MPEPTSDVPKPADQEIMWRDFYFPPRRHSKLLERVFSATPSTHPIAVTGQIKSIKASEGKPLISLFLALADSPATELLVVRNGTDLFKGLVEGQCVAVLRTWAMFQPEFVKGGRLSRRYCTAFVNHPSEFAVVDADLLDGPLN